MSALLQSFYERNAVLVARDLLGAVLMRRLPDGQILSGRIVETEAYTGVDDMASHGRSKITPRNRPMWGPPGRAYVYLSRGIHWMLNAVAEPEGQPAAVLIRAIEPMTGQDQMSARRPGRQPLEWTSGPGKLAVALAVTKAQNEIDLTTPDSGLWIAHGSPAADSAVSIGPRIGMGKTPEPWYSIPWRFWITYNPYVSV